MSTIALSLTLIALVCLSTAQQQLKSSGGQVEIAGAAIKPLAGQEISPFQNQIIKSPQITTSDGEMTQLLRLIVPELQELVRKKRHFGFYVGGGLGYRGNYHRPSSSKKHHKRH